MLRQLIERLFGIEAVNITIVDIAPAMQDPCTRHIDQSSSEVYWILGRNCVPGDFVRNAAATPETAAIQYCRID